MMNLHYKDNTTQCVQAMIRTGLIANDTNVMNDVHHIIIKSIVILPSFPTIMCSFVRNVSLCK